ncbi:Peroxidase [Mycena sanguinolenta]|uniref:Peroxidase n=1 Tax=Mycena sanguinolenta TaxID=230812 RepID=A0A8H7D6P3_9AGAR|nr:Peroxidase [Mycena sanguinolenta]
MKPSTLSVLPLVYVTTVAASLSRTTCSKGRTVANAACCVWFNVLDDIQTNLFERQCGDDAHDALRLSFHDAIGYSPHLGGGGADGSLIQFSTTELNYDANAGLEDIVDSERTLADKWGVSYGDMIQFAATVSVGNCPGGPKISFMAGRPNATQAAPDGLVPEAFDSVSTILARVADAGLTPGDLVALLASHSVGFQEHVDPTIPPTPFDLTPSVFDTKFFYDTMFRLGDVWPGSANNKGEVKSPFPREFRLQSDALLAHDPRTTAYWFEFSLSHSLMANSFATAMAKMALLGQNSKNLYDCSDVVPNPVGHIF